MEYSPLDPEVVRNPYPYYAWLRREAPLYRTVLGFFALSRHEDVLNALRHPELFSSSAMGDAIESVKALSPEELGRGETLLGSDPPCHTRLRKIVNRAFTPKRIAALDGRVRGLAQTGQAGTTGRDHGPAGFSMWMAGGGVKGGHVHGATDEIGHKAVENRVSVHDFHATMLNQLSLDFKTLTYDLHGLDERLTGQYPARVIEEILI